MPRAYLPTRHPEFFLVGATKQWLGLVTRAAPNLARLCIVDFARTEAGELVALCKREGSMRCGPWHAKQWRTYMPLATIWCVLRTYQDAEPKWVRVPRPELGRLRREKIPGYNVKR